MCRTGSQFRYIEGSADRLKEELQGKGLTATEVCRRGGLEMRTLSKFFRYHTGISAATLAIICMNAGISMDYVMGISSKGGTAV